MSSFKSSFKIALACWVSFLLEKGLHLPLGPLVVISTLLVMIRHEDFGSVLKKSYIRLVGSLAGGLLALLALTLWTRSLWIEGALFGLAMLGFALLMNLSKKYQTGGVFGALAFISSVMSHNPGLQSVGLRLLEILIGILVALAISRLVFPLHSKEQLKTMLSRSLLQLSQLYQATFCGIQPPTFLDNPYKFETRLLRSFGEQEQLLYRAVVKHEDKLWLQSMYEKIILCERGIFRSTVFLSRISAVQAHQVEEQLEIRDFHHLVAQCLDQLADGDTSQMPLITTTLQQLTAALLTQAYGAMPARAVYLHTYIGSCQYLSHELHTLGTLMGSLVDSSANHTTSLALPSLHATK